MPLGIDRTHFLQDKIKETEKQLRRKNERVVALETENAMLYLKLAQLHGNSQTVREELSALQTKQDADKSFRVAMTNQGTQFCQDIQMLRKEMEALKKFARDFGQRCQQQLQSALSVVHHHRQVMQSQNSSMAVLQGQVAQLRSSLEEITERHAKEKKRRQELHNTLMELRGNIRVHCRLRPLMDFDGGQEETGTFGRAGTKSEVVVHFIDDENVCVRTTKHNKVFEYEKVYAPVETQDDVFEEVQPMLTSLLDGYNICIMAYGQTGSGKTHTMLGSHKNENYNLSHDPHPDEGVIPRATRELFRYHLSIDKDSHVWIPSDIIDIKGYPYILIEERPEGIHKVEVSVVEIYNNDIRDLLSRDPNAKHDLVTGSDGSLNLPTITSKSVDTVYDVMRLVEHGLRTRRESATLVHEHSSRSHLVVTLTVTSPAPSFLTTPRLPDQTPPDTPTKKSARSLSTPQSPIMFMPGGDASLSSTLTSSLSLTGGSGQQAVIRTKLQLVDLAGSECVGMSGVKGAALREASYINKSLSALADVLGALAENRSHVPYRNARLTHVLQDSIGGDAKLLVLLCVAPAQRYITESLQCLGFGQRARQVQRGPTKRRLPSSVEKVGADRPRSASSSRSDR